MCAVKTLCRGVGDRPSLELRRVCARLVCGADNDKEQRPIRVTVIEGQGTGPVVCAAVRRVFRAALVPVEWDYQTLSVYRDTKTNQTTVNSGVLSSAIETGLVLRAQDSSVGNNDSQWSGSLKLNKALNASVGVRKFESVVGYEPYGPVNLINIRDNVSGEYSEIEHLVVPGVVQSIKTMSRKDSLALAKFAFDRATKSGHSRITALHKANVMRLSDGMFLNACREVSACYPDVEYTEEKLDSFCLNVISNPGRYGILLTTSLYGSFVGSVCGTMSGGPSTVPVAAFGPKAAVFSTMSDYGHSNYGHCDGGRTTVDQTPYDREPVINPTGIIRAAAWMLDHAGMAATGRRIIVALENTIRQGTRTRDVGGNASCEEFTYAIIDNMLDQRQMPSEGKHCC